MVYNYFVEFFDFYGVNKLHIKKYVFLVFGLSKRF